MRVACKGSAPGAKKAQQAETSCFGQSMLQGTILLSGLVMHSLSSSVGLVTRIGRPAPVASRAARPLVQRFVRCMAASTDTQLGKDTPDSKWREILSAEEYNILRKKGTEAPGTGLYNKHYENGEYTCAGCGTLLYKSDTKFDSGCGWPAFYAEIDGRVDRHEDRSFGSVRTEITCHNCGGHLGHEFKGEGFDTPTDSRHCVNSKSLKFKGK